MRRIELRQELVRVLVDANSTSQAVAVYKTMFDLRPLLHGARAFLQSGIGYVTSSAEAVLLILAGALICFLAPNTRQIAERFEPRPVWAVWAGVLLTASLFFMGEVSSFLYFQF